MRNFTLSLCLFYFLFSSLDSFSQTRIDKSIQIVLENNNRPYPKSFLIIDNNGTLDVNAEFKSGEYNRSFQTQVLELDKFEYIKIIDRKKRVRNSIIGAVVFGAAGFIASDRGFNGSQDPNLPLTETGDISGIQTAIVTTLSAGLGFAVGRAIGHKKMSIKEEKDEIIAKLKILGY